MDLLLHNMQPAARPHRYFQSQQDSIQIEPRQQNDHHDGRDANVETFALGMQ